MTSTQSPLGHPRWWPPCVTTRTVSIQYAFKKGLFSVGALDDLDHNPSSTTATSSFHKTGISVFQFPTEGNPGQGRPPITVPPSGTDKHSIPDSYAIVPPTELKTTATSVPEREMHEVNSTAEDFKLQEKGWVEHALQKLNKDGLTSEDCIVWAAYHSSKQQVEKNPPALSAQPVLEVYVW